MEKLAINFNLLNETKKILKDYEESKRLLDNNFTSELNKKEYVKYIKKVHILEKELIFIFSELNIKNSNNLLIKIANVYSKYKHSLNNEDKINKAILEIENNHIQECNKCQDMITKVLKRGF